jgi:hypothetical protein
MMGIQPFLRAGPKQNELPFSNRPPLFPLQETNTRTVVAMDMTTMDTSAVMDMNTPTESELIK